MFQYEKAWSICIKTFGSTDNKKPPLQAIFCLVRQRATLPGPGWVQVPLLLVVLTSVFGMGTGVTPPLKPPVAGVQAVGGRL
jgi:hypothetical protein